MENNTNNKKIGIDAKNPDLSDINEIIIIKDLNGIITGWSVGAEETYQYTSEEAVGKDLRDLLALPENRDDVSRYIEDIKRGKSIIRLTTKRRRKDGVVLTVSLILTPIYVKGKIEYICAIGTDLVRDKEREEKARLILQSMNEAFIEMDDKGRITDWNHKAEEMFGWRRDEIFGKFLADTIVPYKYRDAHWAGLKKFLGTGEAPIFGRTVELTALHRKGIEFPVKLTVSPIQMGSTYKFVGFLRDVSENNTLRIKIADIESLLEQFFQKSLEVSIIMDTTSKPVKINPAFTETFGYSFEDVKNKTLVSLIHPEDRENALKVFNSAVRTKASLSVEYRFLCKNGKYKYTLWRSNTITKDNLLFVSARDLTKEKAFEEELNQRVQVKTDELRKLVEFMDTIRQQMLASLGTYDIVRSQIQKNLNNNNNT